MAAEVPDRLSVEEGSPFYDMKTAKRVEVYFDGARMVGSVMEYCISEGWVRRRKISAFGVPMKDRTGNFIIGRFDGKVEVRWKEGQEQ